MLDQGQKTAASPTQRGHDRLGRYELIARVGAGSLAEVHLARQVGGVGQHRGVVAVHRIHPHLARVKEFVDVLLDDARVSALIKHPNVVDIYDLGISRGVYFIAMEYLAGQPLQAVLARANVDTAPDRLDVLSIARLIADVASGLSAAHEQRSLSGRPLDLVHRDVSPRNILVLYDGGVKLVDFGMARARAIAPPEGGKWQDASRLGRVGYAAPEVITGGAADRRADVFSLGVVMWEALARRRLYDAKTDTGALVQIKQGAPQPPSVHRPEVPRELDRICLRALAADPSSRFQTAGELLAALEGFLTDSGFEGEDAALARFVSRTFAAERDAQEALVRRVNEHEVTSERAPAKAPARRDERAEGETGVDTFVESKPDFAPMAQGSQRRPVTRDATDPARSAPAAVDPQPPAPAQAASTPPPPAQPASSQPASTPAPPQAKSPEPGRPQAKPPEPGRPQAKPPEPARPQAKSPEPGRPQAKPPEPARPQAKPPEPARPQAKPPEPARPRAVTVPGPKEAARPTAIVPRPLTRPARKSGPVRPAAFARAGSPPADPAPRDTESAERAADGSRPRGKGRTGRIESPTDAWSDRRNQAGRPLPLPAPPSAKAQGTAPIEPVAEVDEDEDDFTVVEPDKSPRSFEPVRTGRRTSTPIVMAEGTTPILAPTSSRGIWLAVLIALAVTALVGALLYAALGGTADDRSSDGRSSDSDEPLAGAEAAAERAEAGARAADIAAATPVAAVSALAGSAAGLPGASADSATSAGSTGLATSAASTGAATRSAKQGLPGSSSAGSLASGSTAAGSMAPGSTAPGSTAAGSTAIGSTAAGSTAPGSTAGSTAPGSRAPGSTAIGSTAIGSSSPGSSASVHGSGSPGSAPAIGSAAPAERRGAASSPADPASAGSTAPGSPVRGSAPGSPVHGSAPGSSVHGSAPGSSVHGSAPGSAPRGSAGAGAPSTSDTAATAPASSTDITSPPAAPRSAEASSTENGPASPVGPRTRQPAAGSAGRADARTAAAGSASGAEATSVPAAGATAVPGAGAASLPGAGPATPGAGAPRAGATPARAGAASADSARDTSDSSSRRRRAEPARKQAIRPQASPDQLYRDGARLYLAGELDQARRVFQGAIDASPRFAPAHRGLGLVHERAGQKALAVRSLEMYLRLSPGAPDAAAIRARIERLSR